MAKSIFTKYIGPTDHRGSRVKAADRDGNSIIISYDVSVSSDEAHDKAFLALINKMGWHGEYVAGYLGKGRVYVDTTTSSTFVV